MLCEVDCGRGTYLAGSTCECEPGFGPAQSIAGEALCEVDGRTLFPESRLVTPDWAWQLNAWAGKLDREWSLCCSTFEGCDTAAKFHAACDAHTPTLTVAHNAGDGGSNPGNFTFGGFVRSPPPRLSRPRPFPPLPCCFATLISVCSRVAVFDAWIVSSVNRNPFGAGPANVCHCISDWPSSFGAGDGQLVEGRLSLYPECELFLAPKKLTVPSAGFLNFGMKKESMLLVNL